MTYFPASIFSISSPNLDIYIMKYVYICKYIPLFNAKKK